MGESNTDGVSVRDTTTFVGPTQHNLYFIIGSKLFKDVLSFHGDSHLRAKWVFRCIHTKRKRDRDPQQMGGTILCGNLYYILKGRSHATKFSQIFPPIVSVRYSVNFLDPFAPKFYSSIQNNIGQNFGEGLNFAAYGQSISWVGSWSDCTSIVLCPGSGSVQCEYTIATSSVVGVYNYKRILYLRNSLRCDHNN